ncbi:hypothetical protein CEXT_46741 [Caerostris extrusa]|uniref:Uncharacterized protein n=1 Tax=Caerostris extrusa TaxID=172846 RepID=A0AAV4MYT9_CAEEX|nr:hypothetical protein CEXT_46741 [Caerostris extrusa]
MVFFLSPHCECFPSGSSKEACFEEDPCNRWLDSKKYIDTLFGAKGKWSKLDRDRQFVNDSTCSQYWQQPFPLSAIVARGADGNRN